MTFDETIAMVALHVIAAFSFFGAIYEFVREKRAGSFMVNDWAIVSASHRHEPGWLSDNEPNFNLEFAVTTPQRTIILKRNVQTSDRDRRYDVGTRHPVRYDSRNPEKNFDIGSHYRWNEAMILSVMAFFTIPAVGVFWMIYLSKSG